VKIGTALPQYAIDVSPGDRTWPSALGIARRAEALGLDAVWLSDHPFAIGPDGVASGAFEPISAAAALARGTARIRIGTLVLSSAMRAPGLLAHSFRSLCAIAPARIVAGLGAGWYEPEHRAFGVPLPSYGERIAMLDRTVDALAALGPERPEVLCGGTGARLMELAARAADAWNVAWDVPTGAYSELNRKLDAACERAGRDPRSVARTVGVTVLVAPDERGLDRAVERLRGRAAFLSGVDRASLAERIVCGTPERCAERIAAYGADEVVAALLLRDDPEMLELFATEVAPVLRRD
jgi:alkanesulfonate monooxygenase SsuD/methylene tetrahydromethanopterin reductase-like flavin-dependent oxidoreductase (luciferase family)